VLRLPGNVFGISQAKHLPAIEIVSRGEGFGVRLILRASYAELAFDVRDAQIGLKIRELVVTSLRWAFSN